MAEGPRYGIANEGDGFDGTHTWITISGGVLGSTYTISNLIHLDSGMADSRSFQLIIAQQ